MHYIFAFIWANLVKYIGVHTYISILRGINVSGQKIVKMDALKKMYTKLGFLNCNTYVQSGNVIFQFKNEEPEPLEKIIQNKIKTEFGFDVPVIVMDINKLKRIVNRNPFISDNSKIPSYMHITFLASQPRDIDESAILNKKAPAEGIVFTKEAIYLYCPNGYGKTRLNNNFLENKLKVKATTRNWKTTNKLLELANNI
jgi:uncharacterized protein (DUF1697 family)